MSEFTWGSPLWFLASIPLLVAWRLLRRRHSGAVLFSSSELLDDLPTTWVQRTAHWLPRLRLFALLLVIVALARPQQGLTEFRLRTEGIAILMCLDRSGSMRAMDFQIEDQRVDRLQAVKHVVRGFVMGDRELPGRLNDLIGLISFGGFAEAKSPLTLDHGALLEVLETIEIAGPVTDAQGRVINARYLEEEQATAIGDAITLAVDRLKDSTAKSRVIILMSDGENTAGVISPEEAAQAAAEFGIKIYTIGVGSTGQAPFPGQDMFGRAILQARLVRLDEETLKMIADKTGGKYFNAKDTNTLRQVYAEIDQLEKTVSEGRVYTEYRELFQWIAIPAILLLITERTLRLTRFRAWPA